MSSIAKSPVVKPNRARGLLFLKWEAMAWPHQAAMFSEREQEDRIYYVKRQHGTTLAMAIEAGLMQLQTGRTQVFIAPSIAQAEISQSYLKAFFENDYQAKQFRFLGVGCNLHKYLSDIDGLIDVYVDSHLYMKPKEQSQLESLFKRFREDKKLIRITYSSCRPGNEVDMCICGSPEGYMLFHPDKQTTVCYACSKESNDA